MPLVDELHPDRVPAAEEATADKRKFTDYLLNESHPQGRAKARFFKRLGYDSSNWRELRSTFLGQLPRVKARYSRDNPYGGDHYEAVVRIETTSGKADVRTFWEVHPRTGTRFLTAYPLQSGEEEGDA